MSSKKIEWIKTGSVVAGTVITAVRAIIEYRKFRREGEQAEYTRNLQKTAWKQVMRGELSEAKVGDLHVKSGTPSKPRAPVSAEPKPAEAPPATDTAPAEETPPAEEPGKLPAEPCPES